MTDFSVISSYVSDMVCEGNQIKTFYVELRYSYPILTVKPPLHTSNKYNNLSYMMRTSPQTFSFSNMIYYADIIDEL